ncbi:MAG TPA: FHA domain-containing protein [Vicinamibacteria bacterium]|nr:FHA domain-containing protein [Vicinamibacteria bacterium]
MKFEISYPGGSTHEVELAARLAVLGRDPGCDIVLNDTKCSRRHAIVEDGPQGLVVRDSASANGVYLNGRRVDQAPLRPGDVLRLGEVQLKLVAQVGETVVMAPDDLDLRTVAGTPPLLQADLPTPASLAVTPGPPERPAPVRLPPERRPAEPRAAVEPRTPAEPRPAAPPRRLPVDRIGRPATVNILVALWSLFVPASVAACLLAAARLGGGAAAWTLGALVGLVLAGLGTTMALGLRALAPWARHLQIAAATLGLLACPFTLASATLLLYLTRPEVKAVFEGAPGRGAGEGTAEPTFALSFLGMLVLGLALAAVAVLVF